MGSGKTTVGHALASQLGWEFADLDEHVASREGSPVPAFIAHHGEPAFRDAEVRALAELLARSYLVIALGGGAPETLEIRSLLHGDQSAFTVYLNAPFDVLYERCLVQAREPLATSRPFLAARQPTQQRFSRRVPLYQEIADLTIEAAAAEPESIARTVLRTLKDRFRSPEHSLK